MLKNGPGQPAFTAQQYQPLDMKISGMKFTKGWAENSEKGLQIHRLHHGLHQSKQIKQIDM